MDDQVFPSISKVPDDQKQKGANFNTAVLIIVATILMISTALISYSVGKASRKDGVDNSSEIIRSDREISETPTIIKEITSTPNITGVKKNLSPSVTPANKSKILLNDGELDGYRGSNGSGNSLTDIKVGRSDDMVTRGFISFDITDVQGISNLAEATLRLYQAKVTGSPYKLGAIKLDHLTYGDSLDPSDYGMPALLSNYASVSTSPKIGWKEIDVTKVIKDDLSNARGLSQFRIHFQTEVTGSDRSNDFAYFESAENTLGTGNTPQLIIKYY
jgi:hypothetical protein